MPTKQYETTTAEELWYLLCENLLIILCKLLKVKHHWFINHCYFLHPLLVHAGISWEFYSSYQPNNMKQQSSTGGANCTNSYQLKDVKDCIEVTA
jgi:hypothetical protein